MIEGFYSEFLIHPAPLEYSALKCSHRCAYCFADFRNKEMNHNVSKVVKQLTGQSRSNGLVQKLINMGYPICLSNRTDPFSPNNSPITKKICEVLSALENGIFFQIRGNHNYKEAFDVISNKKNIVVYVSITTKRDEHSKKLEPNAPTYKQRVEIIQQAKKQGWPVICAFNPCIEDVLPIQDIEEITKQLDGIGVTHYIIQKMRLPKTFVSKMPKRKYDALGKNAVDYAVSGKNDYVRRIVNDLRDRGLNALSYGMPYKTDFFKEINKTLGKYFPSGYEFVNYVFDSGKETYTFKDYFNSTMIGNECLLKLKGKEFHKYIMSQNRGVWKDSYTAQNAVSFEDVLRVFWNNKRMEASPQNLFGLFDVADQKDDDGNIILQKRSV